MVYAPKTGIKLPGTSGNYVSTPDHADLDITGDLCLMWKGSFTSLVNEVLVGKYRAANPNRSYLLQRLDTGALRVTLSSDGASTELITTSVIPNISLGEQVEIAVTFDASTPNVTFWLRDPGNSWKLIEIVSCSTASINSGGSDLFIGQMDLSALWYSNAVIHSAQIYDGIGDGSAPGLGTLVAEFDAAKCKPRYRDSTGKVWTLNGSDSTMEKV